MKKNIKHCAELSVSVAHRKLPREIREISRDDLKIISGSGGPSDPDQNDDESPIIIEH
jgi:hypothetical protein